MKKVIVLILVFALSISLIACTKPDAGLYNAFKNMKEITSVETDTNINFEFSGEGFEEEDAMGVAQVASILNSLKINLVQKSVGNEDNTKAQVESNLKINFMGIETPFKMWTDVDLNTTDMKTIIEIPEMLLGMMAMNSMQGIENPMMGKQYLIYDMAKLMGTEDEIDYKEMVEFQKEIQPKMIKFMEDIQKDLKLDFEIIKLKEEKTVEGEKLKVYEVKLDDKSLKELSKHVVNHVLENDATKEFIVEYMDGYMNSIMKMGLQDNLTDEEISDIKEEMEDMEKDLDENLKKFKEEFNAFMERYKDVKVLGEKGINILYSVNKDGYIVEEDGVMDFDIDLSEINKLAVSQEKDDLDDEEMDDLIENQLKDMKGKIKLTVNYNTKNTNINNKDLKVEMPKTTEENSIDLYEMMEVQMQQQKEMLEQFENMEDPEE